MVPKQITLILAIQTLVQKRTALELEVKGTAMSFGETARAYKKVAALTRSIKDLRECLSDARARRPKTCEPS